MRFYFKFQSFVSSSVKKLCYQSQNVELKMVVFTFPMSDFWNVFVWYGLYQETHRAYLQQPSSSIRVPDISCRISKSNYLIFRKQSNNFWYFASDPHLWTKCTYHDDKVHKPGQKLCTIFNIGLPTCCSTFENFTKKEVEYYWVATNRQF